MGFLATLVGLTSVERFIPLATHETERRDVLSAKPHPNLNERRRTRAEAGAGHRDREDHVAPVNSAEPRRRRARCRCCANQRRDTRRDPASRPPSSRQSPQTQSVGKARLREAPEAAVDDHPDRTRGDRRRRALVRLGQAVARARGDDRPTFRAPSPRRSAASCAPTATRSTPSPPAGATSTRHEPDYKRVICTRRPLACLARTRAGSAESAPRRRGTLFRAL
jgi:hypothetical protein